MTGEKVEGWPIFLHLFLEKTSISHQLGPAVFFSSKTFRSHVFSSLKQGFATQAMPKKPIRICARKEIVRILGHLPMIREAFLFRLAFSTSR